MTVASTVTIHRRLGEELVFVRGMFAIPPTLAVSTGSAVLLAHRLLPGNGVVNNSLVPEFCQFVKCVQISPKACYAPFGCHRTAAAARYGVHQR
jgi:hypothetical protein